MKHITELVKGDRIKFEVGDYDMFVTMEVDKVEGSKVYGTILSTRLNIVNVGDYEEYDFGSSVWVQMA